VSADAITVYEVLVNAAGEIDTSGRLKATLLKNQALLEAARAGTEVAKRDLVQAVTEAYFNLALATAKRAGAEANLDAVRDFEDKVRLNVDAGELAPVDLVRARLQTAGRTDELQQAISDESVSAYALKSLIGERISEQISVEDLMTQMPVDNEIERFAETAISTRPELAQFDAERRAAEQDIKAARAERRPQLTYSVSGGFVTDSLKLGPIRDQTGVQATIGFTIPVFDWGASRSRETQARLRLQQTQTTRALAERQFAEAFFSARTQAMAARDRIRRLAASIPDAESNVTASVARYRAGEATINEPVDAANQLITLRQALRQAIFDYQTAKARLARATGQ